MIVSLQNYLLELFLNISFFFFSGCPFLQDPRCRKHKERMSEIFLRINIAGLNSGILLYIH